MLLYFAPMEGLTDALYRQVHHSVFRGIDRYFMPFISPSASLSFTGREMFELSYPIRTGAPAVPQILANHPDYFIGAVRILQDLGYREVNLNLGCPSGTVTAKGKGAGLLKSPDQLARFLDAVCARSPLPLSVKTRIGFDSADEWPALEQILLRYPWKEFIIHPRTSREFYSGQPHFEILPSLLEQAKCPVICNGNLFTAKQAQWCANAYPRLSGLMLGRGVAANPALAQETAGGERLTKEALLLFHDRLYRAYQTHWPESAVIGRMHGVMAYLGFCFTRASRQLRLLRKAVTPEEYADAVRRLFDECELADPPLFIPPEDTER